MMKRLLSLALVLCMVLSFSVCAFAAESETGDGTEDTPSTTVPNESASGLSTTEENGLDNGDSFSFVKQYKVTGTSPEETFEFSSTLEDWPTGVDTTKVDLSLTIGTAHFDSLTNTSGKKAVSVQLPTYPKVGTYVYKISETDKGTAGVTYASPIAVVVQVVNEIKDGKITGNLKCYVTIYNWSVYDTPNAKKTEGFIDGTGSGGDGLDNANKYEAGKLQVEKIVAGLEADQTEYFKFTITLNGDAGDTYASDMKVTGGSKLDGTTAESSVDVTWTNGVGTAVIYLKHGDTATIENIPYNVTYTVEEDTPENYTMTYKVTQTASDNTASTPTNQMIDSTSELYEVTNTDDGEINTGISLDTIPYIAMMLIATAGLAVVLTKKRGSEN